MGITRSEAKRQLVAAFPGRSVMIGIADWHHTTYPGTPISPAMPERDMVEYSVAIVPGYGAEKCSRATASTLDRAVELALDWVKDSLIVPPPVAAVLDEQFSPEGRPPVVEIPIGIAETVPMTSRCESARLETSAAPAPGL